MNVEITKEAFNALLNRAKPESTEQGEHYRKTLYLNKGVQLIELENFLSCVTQYYVQDINA